MIYLSANGAVLGQFEESAVPQVLADRKITAEAFYWREGMAEWRPVSELAKPAEPKVETIPVLPKLVAAPVAAKTAFAPAEKSVAASATTPAPQVGTPKPVLNPVPAAKQASLSPAPVAAKPAASSAQATTTPAVKKTLLPQRPEAGVAGTAEKLPKSTAAFAASSALSPAQAITPTPATASGTVSKPIAAAAISPAPQAGAAKPVLNPVPAAKQAIASPAPVAAKPAAPSAAGTTASVLKKTLLRQRPEAGAPGTSGKEVNPAAAKPLLASPQEVTPKPVAASASMAKPAAAGAASSAGSPAQASSGVTGSAPKKTVIPRRAVVSGADAPSKLTKPEQSPGEKDVESPPSGSAFAGGDKGTVEPPRPAADKSFTPRRAPSPPSDKGEQRPVVPTGSGRKSRLVWLLVLLLLVAAAGGGAWWWLNRAPAAIPGRVSLSGEESGPVEIRVFRREELAGPWRERLAAADARAAELENLVAEAQEVHRQRVILYDEAAGVCAVGEEYNMPDVEELRADRDTKKAEADAAKAELDGLQAEKETLLTIESLLETVPAPLQTIVADAQGSFLLPPPEPGEIILLATASSQSEGNPVARGWLEVLEILADGAPPEAVQLSETDLLDVDKIRNFAGAAP
jgi:hypothetical protein